MINSVAVMALSLKSFYIAANKEYLTKRPIISSCVNSAFLQLYCRESLFKLANISGSYEEHLRAPFFR